MREQSLFDLLKMILMKILDELSKRKKNTCICPRKPQSTDFFKNLSKQGKETQHETSPYNQGRQQEIKIKAKMGTSMQAFIPEEPAA